MSIVELDVVDRVCSLCAHIFVRTCKPVLKLGDCIRICIEKFSVCLEYGTIVEE